MSQQNIELVKKGYDAFSAGDIETLMALFDDNVEWVQPGQSAISGTYHGKGELGQLFTRLAEKSTQATPQRFVSDDELVVVLADVTVGGEHGRDADVFTIRNGKAVRVEMYTDTALMERVYGRKKAVAGQ